MSAGEHALALIALAWQRLADTLQTELTLVRAERDRAVSRAEGLVLEIEAARAAAAAHGREPDGARDDLAAKLKASRSDFAELSGRCSLVHEQPEATADELKKTASERDAALGRVAELHNGLENLRFQLGVARAEREQAEGEAVRLSSEAGTLRASASMAIVRESELRQHLERAEGNYRTASETSVHLAQRVEELREDWRREAAARAEAEARLGGVTKECAGAAERAEVAEQQAAQLRGELRDAEAEIAELRKSLSADTAALAVSESQRLVEEYTAAVRAAGEVSDG